MSTVHPFQPFISFLGILPSKDICSSNVSRLLSSYALQLCLSKQSLLHKTLSTLLHAYKNTTFQPSVIQTNTTTLTGWHSLLILDSNMPITHHRCIFNHCCNKARAPTLYHSLLPTLLTYTICFAKLLDQGSPQTCTYTSCNSPHQLLTRVTLDL